MPPFFVAAGAAARRTPINTRCRCTCTSPNKRERSTSASGKPNDGRWSCSPIRVSSPRDSAPCTRRTCSRTRRSSSAQRVASRLHLRDDRARPRRRAARPHGSLRAGRARLCTGIDSHVITDPIDDLRALETHERLRTQTRVTFQTAGSTPAEQLWREGSDRRRRRVADSRRDAGAELVIERTHPSLDLVEPGDLLDAIVFGGSAAMVARIQPNWDERARGLHDVGPLGQPSHDRRARA